MSALRVFFLSGSNRSSRTRFSIGSNPSQITGLNPPAHRFTVRGEPDHFAPVAIFLYDFHGLAEFQISCTRSIPSMIRVYGQVLDRSNAKRDRVNSEFVNSASRQLSLFPDPLLCCWFLGMQRW